MVFNVLDTSQLLQLFNESSTCAATDALYTVLSTAGCVYSTNIENDNEDVAAFAILEFSRIWQTSFLPKNPLTLLTDFVMKTRR